jgi:ABC-2 type transport system permease protein
MSGLFPNAWHVARREYRQRVLGRTFVVTTGILALVALGYVLLPVILRATGVDRPAKVAVMVNAPDISGDPVATLDGLLRSGSPAGTPGAPKIEISPANDAAAARRQVAAGDLDGLLTISRETGGDLAFDYLTNNEATDQAALFVRQGASALAIADRLERAGLTPADRSSIFAPPDLTTSAASAAAGRREDRDFGASLLLAYILVVLTFMAILTYGNWVAQSVAEEKSSRVMELLITAASPRQLLAGKVLGAGAAGLSQFAVVILAALVGLLAGPLLERVLGGAAPAEGSQLPPLTIALGLALGAFFMGGFVLYSTLYAAAGSMVSRQEDVQAAASPLMILAMAGYFVSFSALNGIDQSWVAVLSVIPFFSPYLMPARILLGEPAAWEVALAIGLLALAVLSALWVAARIYSAGVLLYGQRPGVREVWRATRASR